MTRRWPLLIAGLAILIAPFAVADGAIGASACPAGEPCVLVSVVGSQESETVVTAAQVAAGDVNAEYELRPTTGAKADTETFAGLSMRELISSEVGLPIGSVTFVEITVRTGRTFTLDQADLGDPADSGYPFPSGAMPAIYAAGSEFLGYVRPVRDDTDANDYEQSTEDGSVSVIVHTTGSLITPVVTADADSVAAGTSVTYAATVADAPSGSLSYSWNYGDGTVETAAATAPHVYSAAGTYATRVTVRGSDGSLGISRPVTVTVGDAPAPVPNATTTGAGTATTPAPTTGPVTSTGTTGGAKPSTSKPTAKATPKPTSSSTRTPKPTPKPTPSKTTTPAATPTPTSTYAASPTATTTSDPGTNDAGVAQVSGVVIAGSASDPEVDSDAADNAADAATAPGSAASSSGQSLGWAGAGLGTLLLLGAGVLGESGLLGTWLAKRKRWTK